MHLKNKPDIYLLAIVSLLVVLGLVILCSASVVLSQERLGQSYSYLKHQLVLGLAVGLICAFVAYKIPYRYWRNLAIPLVLTSLVLLILVLTPQVNYQFGGAKRWLHLGSLTLQPSEMTKLAVIIYLAAMLGRQDSYKQKLSGSTKRNSARRQLLVVLGLLAFLSLLLILQPDISTLGVIILSSLVVYLVAGAPLRYLLLLGSTYTLSLALLIKLAPYRWHRWLVYLNPNIDLAGIGYQVNQALLAIGSGGIFGLGLGHSRQKYNYLPEPMGDSIFAILGEEWGFVGAILILILFVLLFIRSFQIAKKSNTNFGRLLALGIGSWLFFQAFINMAAACALLPMTGVPLPFISYGGSSMVISLIAVGILLNISKDKTRIMRN